MAPRRTKVNKLDYKNLSEADVICPICRSILIKPVSLPCSHGFCSLCFETSTSQNANVLCPVCSVRIGSWLRTAAKSNKLVNEPYWQAIQQNFSMQVKNKLKELNKTPQAPQQEKQQIGNKRKRDVVVNKEFQKTDNLPTENSKSQLSLPSNAAVNNVNVISKGKSIVTEKRPLFIRNLATKEYTCRILCQDTSNSHKPVINKELLQRKNKRIQELKELESSSERSNSIESECIYFKPIDYRHNPPSEGLPPIKVPTKRASVSPQMKIVAPVGQNKITTNYFHSAFARLYSPKIVEEKVEAESESKSLEHQNTQQKRKNQKVDTKAKKKLKLNEKSCQNQTKGKDTIKAETNCDTNLSKSVCKASHLNLIIIDDKKSTNEKLVNAEQLKKALQEQADFELATKLQETYNQSATYSTRSAVLKRMATKNQVKIEEFIKPYKVN